MTDLQTTETEHFWDRVRSALGAMRPIRQDRPPAYGQAAIARSIGMKQKLGMQIEDELAAGWSAAASRRVSLCLLVVEIDRFSEYFTAYGRDAADETVLQVMRTVEACLKREGDVCLRLGRASFVVVLPDLPLLVARKLAKAIDTMVGELALAHKESHAGVVTISQGIAAVNPQGNYDRKFFEAADGALKKARRKGMGRLESVDLRPAQERKRKAA